jgi:uncharacterized paraquat-inducible protein A
MQTTTCGRKRRTAKACTQNHRHVQKDACPVCVLNARGRGGTTRQWETADAMALLLLATSPAPSHDRHASS